MAQRSLNKVQLIGNLTRDPELRYTPQGTAVCTFGLATNRSWTTESGEKKEDVEFHRLVAWNKLAELCAQLLSKGRKIFAEGRLQTRQWSGQDGMQRQTTEIVIDEMIILDSRRDFDEAGVSETPAGPAVSAAGIQAEPSQAEETGQGSHPQNQPAVGKQTTKSGIKTQSDEETINEDDIPF